MLLIIKGVNQLKVKGVKLAPREIRCTAEERYEDDVRLGDTFQQVPFNTKRERSDYGFTF